MLKALLLLMLISCSQGLRRILGTRSLRMTQTAPFKASDKVSSAAFKASVGFEYSGDLLVVPFYKSGEKSDKANTDFLKKAIPQELPDPVKTMLAEILEEGVFQADAASKQLIRVSLPGLRYIVLLGLGPNPKQESKDLEVASALRIGKALGACCKDINAVSAGVVLPNGTSNAGITQLILGFHDALYQDNRYKKVPEEGFKPLKIESVTLIGCSEQVASSIGLTYRLTSMISDGVAFAKDLVNAPPNSKTPVEIADLARKISAEHNLKCVVLGEEECKERGMGGYLGVQQGSMYPPQFIHLTYTPEASETKPAVVALVGKGLTFDSGGYNLKAGPGSMIELMKFDMGGCAAVLGCAKAIGQLRPKNVEVHFITAVCENMISSQAMKPGDILTASNGKTIEVLNTDAEGRLTLADALVYAEKETGATTIVDLATLTGAAIVALGERIACLYSSDEGLRTELEGASKRSDEPLWPMPLEPSYKELIKSTIADLKNIGGKGGGSITAALFLQEFVQKSRWAHIDMAGPVWQDNKATGYGVKLLVDFLLNLKPPSK